MKRLLILFIIIAAVAVGAGYYFGRYQPAAPSATPLADDLVVLYEPLPGQTGVTSPLTVRGKARGTWYFEASFPVTLKDYQGNILAQAPAQAKGDWMTTEFVEFEVTLVFQGPTATETSEAAKVGTLILQKDNPSGLPQYDDSREITIYFK